MSEKLSPHFSLDEMTFSGLAVRKGIKNVPNASQKANLGRLCNLILEPVRVRTGLPVSVTSGFRCDALNRAAGGSPTSEHKDGRASDTRINGMTPLEVCRLIVEMDLPFNQVIHEFGSWCHVSVCAEGEKPKRQLLTAKKVGGKTVYIPGLEEV